MNFSKIYIQVYQLFLSIIIALLSFALPSNPSSVVSSRELLFIVLFSCLIVVSFIRTNNLHKNNNYQNIRDYSFKLFAIFSLFIAFGFGIIAGNPTHISKDEAIDKTEPRYVAAETGIKNAESVVKGKVDEQEAIASIEESIEEQSEQNIAKIALTETLAKYDSLPSEIHTEEKIHIIETQKDEILKSAAETVNILEGQWSCEDIGCAYGDQEKIWNVSSNDRNLGMILSLVSLMLIVSVANTRSKKISG